MKKIGKIELSYKDIALIILCVIVFIGIIIMFVYLNSINTNATDTNYVEEEIEQVNDEQKYTSVVEDTTTMLVDTSIKVDQMAAEMVENIEPPTTYQLDVAYLPQNPELPTGCEAVALTTVLNYLGYDVSKETIVNDYLPKGEVGKTDPNYAFVGNPYSIHGFGCFAPAITETANNYLQSVDGNDIAFNISGKDMDVIVKDYLLKYDRPIVIWASIGMAEIHNGVTWVIDGKEITWRANDHCLVLIGYDEENYIFSDPLVGITKYNKELFTKRYEQNQKNAVILLDKGVDF